MASLLGSDILRVLLMVDLRCGDGVDIFPGGEGFGHGGIVGEVGHETKFDLRIVSRKEQIARRGDESAADLATHGLPDRYILQIRIG